MAPNFGMPAETERPLRARTARDARVVVGLALGEWRGGRNGLMMD